MNKRTEGEVVASDTQNRVDSTGHHVTQHSVILRSRELGTRQARHIREDEVVRVIQTH
jgi:hypothetical protein